LLESGLKKVKYSNFSNLDQSKLRSLGEQMMPLGVGVGVDDAWLTNTASGIDINIKRCSPVLEVLKITAHFVPANWNLSFNPIEENLS